MKIPDLKKIWISFKRHVWDNKSCRYISLFCVIALIAWSVFWYFRSTEKCMQLTKEDISNCSQLCEYIYYSGRKDSVFSAGKRIWDSLPQPSRMRIASVALQELGCDTVMDFIVRDINQVVSALNYYDENYFSNNNFYTSELKEINRLSGNRYVIKRRDMNYKIFQGELSTYIRQLKRKRVFIEDNPPFATLLTELVSLLIGVLAAGLGFIHISGLNRVQFWLTKTGDELTKNMSDLTSLVGLEGYIENAAKIYSEGNDARVVTCLKNWVSRGKPGEQIEEGLKDKTHQANEYFFVGKIEWDRSFSGVMWRFNIARKHLGVKGQVLHVDKEFPLFVVSKRINESTIDRGSLLVGNRSIAGASKTYGINLGKNDPTLVECFNFIFEGFIQANAIDGIQKIFDLEDFKICLQPLAPNKSASDINGVCKCAANRIAQMLIMLSTPNQSVEQSFVATALSDIEGIANEFLLALVDSKILQVVGVGDKGAKLEICPKFKTGPSPTCKDFFQKTEVASQETTGTEGQGNGATKC